MADANSRTAPTGIRNRALLLTMASTGIRVQEALDLMPKDVDLEARRITVQHGKGDKRRVVPITMRSAVDALERWLDTRKAREINGHHRAFCTLEGGPMKQQYVRQVLPRLATRAGLEKRVHPHGLRHYFAASMSRRGLQPVFLQDVLGHGSLHTMTTYLRRLTSDDAIDAALRIGLED